ncbi:MAG: putative 2-hydroxyacid dehydrogenase [Planctomycetes bacterium ADurb.Bin401]|nr:MAG: putative 2-hydroxyacid dehydrogenase [Planctomycetes bacterium ADurb.Bin401]
MKNILVDVDINADGLKRLESIKGVNVQTIPPVEDFRRIEPDIIKDKHILFCSFPPTNLADMKQLEFIQLASAGYTQLFDLGLAERNIKAANAAGVNDIPIAQWNIAMMINLARDMRRIIRNQEAGIWDRPARFQMDIRGKTVGIWGYGGIGRETARLARAIGMNVYALDVRVGLRENMYAVEGTGDKAGILPNRVFSPDQKKEFLNGLDFLVLSMPLTKKTEGMIGYEELCMLPAHAFVLNPARGPLIKEQALLQILREGKIAGAALDTHYYYPMPADHPLWRFPNVIMTPHISGSTHSPNFLPLLWDLFVQNIERYISGKPLLNELSPEQLKGS